jgi:hypothetical protein
VYVCSCQFFNPNAISNVIGLALGLVWCSLGEVCVETGCLNWEAVSLAVYVCSCQSSTPTTERISSFSRAGDGGSLVRCVR